MKLVVLFWLIMIVMVIAQALVIIYFMKRGESINSDCVYSEDAIEQTQKVIGAINVGKIKKNIITNSAPKYDGQSTLFKYKVFLNTKLMRDISELNEERYDG